MTLQDFTSLVSFPYTWGFATPRYSSSIVDAAGEGNAFIFHAPVAGDIVQLGFRTLTVTTGGDVLCQIETVDLATGLPSGSLVNGGATATVTIDAADDNTWFLSAAFGTAASVTKGQLLAAVVKADVGFAGNLILAFADRMGSYQSPSFPYITFNTGSWGKSGNIDDDAVIAITYSGGVYHEIPKAIPVNNFQNILFNSSDTPDEVGNIFQLPVPARVTGFWTSCDWSAGDVTINLYDSDGSSVIANTVLGKDVRMGGTGAARLHYFDEAPVLLKDTNYRITVVPGASDARFMGFEVNTAAMLAQMGGGTTCHKTFQTDGGGFSQTTTQRMGIGVLLDQFDDGVGGGGGGLLTHPGTSGGMRG